MTAPTSMRENILSAAEARIRTVGYNAVSFRDIASDVGVKSASVHYHFPQKQDLGIALVRRYKDNFLRELSRIAAMPGGRVAMLDAYLDLYDQAYEVDQKMCLCAVLSAESLGLPGVVKDEIKAFFQANMDWLEATFLPWPRGDGCPGPGEIVAAMEGAMIVSAAMGDRAILRETADRMRKTFREM